MKADPSNTAQNFDTVKFLEIRGLDETQESELRKRLETNMSEYVLLKLLDELPKTIDKKLEETKISDVDSLDKFLRSYVPNLKEKINEFLLEFKKQYKYE
jgi:putative heme iron utilization protein